jgi:hypothetical protein
VCFEIVGYLLEELRDSTNLDAFKRDLEDANVFIGSLIFIEELAEKVRTQETCKQCTTTHSYSMVVEDWQTVKSSGLPHDVLAVGFLLGQCHSSSQAI